MLPEFRRTGSLSISAQHYAAMFWCMIRPSMNWKEAQNIFVCVSCCLLAHRALPCPSLSHHLHHYRIQLNAGVKGLNRPLWKPSMAIISILLGNKGTHLWRWWWGCDRGTRGGGGVWEGSPAGDTGINHWHMEPANKAMRAAWRVGLDTHM